MIAGTLDDGWVTVEARRGRRAGHAPERSGLLRRQDAAPRGRRLPNPRQEGQLARPRPRARARPRPPRAHHLRAAAAGRQEGGRRRRREGARPRSTRPGRWGPIRRSPRSAACSPGGRWRWRRRSTGRLPPRRPPPCSTTCCARRRCAPTRSWRARPSTCSTGDADKAVTLTEAAKAIPDVPPRVHYLLGARPAGAGEAGRRTRRAAALPRGLSLRRARRAPAPRRRAPESRSRSFPRRRRETTPSRPRFSATRGARHADERGVRLHHQLAARAGGSTTRRRRPRPAC